MLLGCFLAGDRMLSDFRESLIDSVGIGSTKILMEGMDPKNEFGWYGKLDLKIVVEPHGKKTRSGN